jgi:predicted permease
MGTLFQDIRYGIRQLRKNPGFTAVAILTLALGIGANANIFSIINGILIRPLPVRAPEQIILLAAGENDAPAGVHSWVISYPNLLDLRKQANGFSDLFAYHIGRGGFTADGQSNQFTFSYVTGNYFSALGVKPALGRLFLPNECETPGEESIVVLGYTYWLNRFGGNPAVIGKQVRINGRPSTVVGVVAKEFHGLYTGFEMEGYLPVSMMTHEQESKGFWTNRNLHALIVFGRLKPGVSLSEAQTEINVAAGRLAQQYPELEKGFSIRLYPERLARPQPASNNLQEVIAGSFLVVAGLVLMLACVNVANILLVRATVRQREMAIRAALGAARRRLIRQMLTEGFLLALFGGIAGIILGSWALNGIGLVSSLRPETNISMPLSMDFSFDWRVLTYALVATFVTGIVVGMWPALRASRTNLNAVLLESGRSDSAGAGRHRMRNILVVAQIAGSLMLLIVAGLFLRSLESARRMSLGFNPDHVLNVIMDPKNIGYDKPRIKEFYRKLKSRALALPGVQSASLAFSVPIDAGFHVLDAPINIENHPLPPEKPTPLSIYNSIDEDYFKTMEVPLLRGRAFTAADDETALPVAIVNKTMADFFWPDEDPIGKRFNMRGTANSSMPWVQVVGVAGNGKYLHLSESPQPYFYVPLAQNYSSQRALQIRTAMSPESLITKVQEEVRKLDPDLPIAEIKTMRQILAGLLGLYIFQVGAFFAAVMGFLGLALAVIGVYGVVAYASAQRTHEIGIRIALGANLRDVLILVLRQGVRLVIAGVILGLIAAWALTRLLSSLLVEVGATDPLAFIGATAVLAGVALLACYVPARRATRMDPVSALRCE